MKLFVVILLLVNSLVLFVEEPVLAIPEGQTITTLVVREKAGISTVNYPLTFGHVFKKGDVSSAVSVKVGNTILPTQCDIRRHYDDGSIKHAVISVVLPEVEASQDLTLELVAGGQNAGTGEMTKEQILATDIESRIELTDLSGSEYSGDLTASLRKAISDSGTLRYWLNGSVCTEILVDQRLNNSLNATWEMRFYPGTKFGIRISNSIENVSVSYRGNISYDVNIYLGSANPALIYTKEGFNHTHNSRWRKIFWLGPEPPEVEIRYKLPCLISAGLIMNYDTNLVVAESEISKEYSNWQNADADLGGNGFITKYFPQTGGRREIGIQPKWTVMYLLSMDNRMREIMLGNAYMAGHCPVHYREDDPAKSFYGHPVSIDDRKDIDIAANQYMPSPIGSINNNGWTIDRAHQGSFVYVPYLITGEYWYLQELYYWASYDLAYDNYGRDGKGNSQDFSQGHDGSFGLIYGQMRGVAWALRTIANAAAIAEDGSIEQEYFSKKLNNNIEWFYKANTENSHGLHAFRNSREHADGANPWKTTIAPWQHDFIVIVLTNIIRSGPSNSAKLIELRDRLGYFTVGRFTNHPAFNKWDGAGYWWPLRRKSDDNTGDYFANGSWQDYWDSILECDQEIGHQGLPYSDFSRYDYPDSYAFIARAALSNLRHLNKGKEAWDFLNESLSIPQLSNNPTWAIVPTTSFNELTISQTADLNSDGSVNILDLQSCVNHILGIQDWGGAKADVNEDGSVDVLDVQEVVNAVLKN